MNKIQCVRFGRTLLIGEFSAGSFTIKFKKMFRGESHSDHPV
ncbi:MAG: hypothetical protein ABIL46_07540 [candidate division WOR-3 bacterium]